MSDFWNGRRIWWGIAGIAVVTAVILLIAPEEATLGAGIRSVYVHVALIWVGLAGFVVAGLLGVGLLVTGYERLYPWLRTIGWIGVGFFAAGLAMSAVSSKVNWGAVFWQEPRMRSSSTSLAIAVIVMVAMEWFPWLRVRGLMMTAVPLIFFWLTARTKLVLHPGNPILTSNSVAIQATFVGLFVLVGLAAALLVWRGVKRDA
ncbi:MAG: hypothetical protein H6667_03805 [Ardenticatenaceae bacterium]|nr:hypothetical protein [Ardenticatenaceae bacterium]